MMENNEQISLVYGEFGEIVGLITMEDIIETLIGMEIIDESDHVDDMRKLARQKWQERAKKIGLIS